MKVYGLIGKSIEHSFSPRYFKEKFKREKLTDHHYQLFPLTDIANVRALINKHPEIAGLNVTIPFKQDIIPHLDTIDPIAREIGAVNTIKIIQDNQGFKLIGFNTDAYGFLHSCPALHSYKPALILGTGGASLAVKYVLKQLQIPFLSVSRHPKSKREIGYGDLSEKLISKYKLIINTTPVGMFPDVDQMPSISYQALSRKHFLYDLIYNPPESLFLQKGRVAGATIQNGMRMLELQAERAWEIWNE